jgi:ankyrin repeat protein
MRARWWIAIALAGAAWSADLRLVDAVKRGDEAAVAALVKQHVDLNAPEADGTTALHWAAHFNNAAVVDLLLAAGANVKTANLYGDTPLFQACENGNGKMAEKLLQAAADPNSALPEGETVLMTAARSGNAAAVKALLERGAHVNVKEGWRGETALMFAARVGDLESARLLVAAGANVNDADAWGVSATTLAAHSGFTDLVLFLLNAGADPNAAPNGFTALHEAIMRRDEKMVAALLEHHADPNVPLKTFTPTRRSSDDFHFEPALVGATPYWLAARFTEPDIMRLLVKHGADPLFVHHADWVAEQGFGGVQRKENVNALMAAVGMLRASPWVEVEKFDKEALTLETVKLAVELGADLNLTNTDGRTALDSAKALRYDSVVNFLAGKGAKAGVPSAAPGGRGGRGGGRTQEPTK